MKAFFTNKFNIAIMSIFFVGVVCLVLLVVSDIFYPIALAFFDVGFVCLTIKLYLRQKAKNSVDIDDFYFDATELSYDEEVYFVGDDEKKVPKKKSKLARFDEWSWTILCGVFSVFFLIWFITALV